MKNKRRQRERGGPRDRKKMNILLRDLNDDFDVV